MKKALALVLALVLAMSLGVSAFALTFVDLKPESSSSSSKDEIVVGLEYDDEEKIFLAPSKGGTYYFELNHDGIELKNIEVTTTGPISAEIVKFDADKMSGYGDGKWYLTKTGEKVDRADLSEKEQAAFDKVYDKLKDSGKYDEVVKDSYEWYNPSNGNTEPVSDTKKVTESDTLTELGILKWYLEQEKETKGDFEKAVKAALANMESKQAGYTTGWTIRKVTVFNGESEAFVKALASGMNSELRTSRFSASTSVDGEPMLKVTVDANYTAAYKEASFKVTATRVDEVNKDTKRVTKSTKVVYKGTIISDVTIFEYEEVKWAGKEDVALEVGEKGYSDYYVNGKYGEKYIEESLREADNATVVSTTAFRALRENKYGLKVAAGEGLLVTISEIGSSQKGVNFEAYGVTFVDANKDGDIEKVKFGFYGNQTVASDFVVEADLGVTAYKLREKFGEKVEEEDIITYYIVEDKTVVGQFTVDYMKDEIDEDLVLEINRKAGSTLGQYEIVLEAPAADNKGEENPNTGAESVIGVVAAMAVVSVAAAAAVSLKK